MERPKLHSQVTGCSRELLEGGVQSGVEAGPVVFGVAGATGLGVDLHGLSAALDGDFEAAGGALVRNEVELELVGVGCVQPVLHLLAVLEVASAAAVVDRHGEVRLAVAGLARLGCAEHESHAGSFLQLYLRKS